MKEKEYESLVAKEKKGIVQSFDQGITAMAFPISARKIVVFRFF